MNALSKTLSCSIFLAFSLACGGAADLDEAIGEDELAASYEPMNAWAKVSAKADDVTPNPQALALEGTLAATGRSYTWQWTVVGDDSLFVEVAASSRGVKVLSSEKRLTFVAPVTFEAGKLAVEGQDALALLAKAGCEKPKSLRLAPVAKTGVRWEASCAQGKVFVDGATGAVSR